MSKKSKEREARILQAWNEAFEKAVCVDNEIDLKTEIGKKSLVIRSSDPKLYARLLGKLPKERVSVGVKGVGKLLAGFGAALTVMSFGALSFVGVPMVAMGAAVDIAGGALDDYKDYSLSMDYDNKQVIFVKIKGNPCLELPKNHVARKISK